MIRSAFLEQCFAVVGKSQVCAHHSWVNTIGRWVSQFSLDNWGDWLFVKMIWVLCFPERMSLVESIFLIPASAMFWKDFLSSLETESPHRHVYCSPHSCLSFSLACAQSAYFHYVSIYYASSLFVECSVFLSCFKALIITMKLTCFFFFLSWLNGTLAVFATYSNYWNDSNRHK